MAFYFNENEEGYAASLMGVDLAVVASIVSAVPEHRRHVTILSGTLPQYKFVSDKQILKNVVDRLLGRSVPAWTTIQSDDLTRVLSTIDIVAFVVDGLIPPDAREVHRLLTTTTGYLGAIESLPAETIGWVIYDNSLPARYRIVGKELRIFYRKAEFDAGADRDEMPMEAFRESGLVARVIWEDTGMRDSYFDPYKTLEHAQTSAEVEVMVTNQMTGVVNEIFLRAAQLDPRLVKYLHGAFKSFERIDTSDALAHAALSCRRFIENLANALYPPREGKINNRLLGKAEYRNRLWAYVQDELSSNSQRQLVLTTLEDVGNRIDKLDTVANSGLHSDIDQIETRRLLVGLTTLMYDLLTLTEPPLATPAAPYNDYARETMTEMLRTDPD